MFEHSMATASLVILGFFECMAISWVYGMSDFVDLFTSSPVSGVDNLLDNIKWMIRFYPPFYIVWKILWKIVCPVIFLVSLLVSR